MTIQRFFLLITQISILFPLQCTSQPITVGELALTPETVINETEVPTQLINLTEPQETIQILTVNEDNQTVQITEVPVQFITTTSTTLPVVSAQAPSPPPTPPPPPSPPPPPPTPPPTGVLGVQTPPPPTPKPTGVRGQCKDPVGDWFYEHGWATNFEGQVCTCINGLFRCGPNGALPNVPVCPATGCTCMDYLGNFEAQSGWSTTYQILQLQCTCTLGYWNCFGLDGAPNRCIQGPQIYNSGEAVSVNSQTCVCDDGFVNCGQVAPAGGATPGATPTPAPTPTTPVPVPVPVLPGGTGENVTVQGTPPTLTTTTCVTIYDTLVGQSQETGEFSILVSAIDAVNLQPTLDNPESSITFFAVTNQAFENLLAVLNVQAKVLFEDPLLQDVLLYHIVDQVINTTEIQGSVSFATENGQEIQITNNNGIFTVQPATGEAATVLQADVPACSGNIQVIDSVLLPVIQ